METALSFDVYHTASDKDSCGWKSIPQEGETSSPFISYFKIVQLDSTSIEGVYVNKAKEVESHSYSVPIWEFIYENKKYTLNKPLNLEVYKNELGYTLENEKLNIFSSNEDFKSAYLEFIDHLFYFYNYYKDISDDDIIGNAIELKNIYADLVNGTNL